MKNLVTALSIVLMGLSMGFSALATEVQLGHLKFGQLDIHYGVYSSEVQGRGEDLGDVLFLHGYGDTFENHRALFKELNDAGMRVIGFDYPSHGKTRGAQSEDLNAKTFDDLTAMAHEVWKRNSDSSRPLIIAGWSTGGLHAVRIAQESKYREMFPTLEGLVLFAPGVSVKKCVGSGPCVITNETLTQNPLLMDRAITPKSPLLRMDFASRLLFNAWKSWQQPLPSDLPTLVFVAGKNDQYVKSNEIKRWVVRQQDVFGSQIQAYQCPRAFHELDNEPAEYGGEFVRKHSAQFASSVLRGARSSITTQRQPQECQP